MYKIKDETIKNVECYLDFANAWSRMPNGAKIEKYSPRIWVKGVNAKNEKPQIMVETFISDEELKNLRFNEEIDLKEYITDVLFFPNGYNFENVEFLWNFSNPNKPSLKVTVKRIAEDILNFKANMEEINLEYDIEILIPTEESK